VGLAYLGKAAENLTVLAFSPLILSHYFSRFHSRCGPGAAQARPRAFSIEVSGESVSDSFNLAADEYQIICAIEGHFAAGMKGTLVAGSG
jgi:hypothetical protein